MAREERESDERRDQRVDRIIDEFICAHPTGCFRDGGAVSCAELMRPLMTRSLRRVIRAGTAALRCDFELSTNPMERIADYDEFLERLKSTRKGRLRNQGRLTVEDQA